MLPPKPVVIEPRLDFKAYIDMAAQAATRTRNSLYFFIIIFVSVFCTCFNTYWYRWTAKRSDTLVQAYGCIVTKVNSGQPLAEYDDYCEQRVAFAYNLGLPTLFSTQNMPRETVLAEWRKLSSQSESDRHQKGDFYSHAPGEQPIILDYADLEKLYQDHIRILLQKRSDLRTIQVPVFGTSLDLENLGIVSGFAFFVILLVLRANMFRELDALQAAKENVLAREERESQAKNAVAVCHEERRILRSIQVLASPRPDNLFFKWLIPLFLCAAPLLHGAICWNDIVHPHWVALVMGRDKYLESRLWDLCFLALIIAIAVFDIFLWYRLLRMFNEWDSEDVQATGAALNLWSVASISIAVPGANNPLCILFTLLLPTILLLGLLMLALR